MAKTLNHFMGATNSYAPGTTEYLPIANSQNPSTTATEVQRQLKSKFSATLSKLRVRVPSNTLSTASTTIRFRKNNANGNQVVTITPGATGVFEDTTNSDSIVDTDLYNISIVVDAGGTGTMLPVCIQFDYSKASGVTQVMAGVGVPTSSAASTTFSAAFAGSLANATTVAESRKQPVSRASATLANLEAYIVSNARTTDTTIRSRKNGANGNLLITITAGATGYFEDTSNSDSLVDGDTFNYVFVTGTGTGSIGWSIVAATYTPTSTLKSILLAASNSAAASVGSASTIYAAVSGAINGTATTEANTESKFNYTATLTNFFVSLSSNTYTSTKTVNFRKNAANGNQSLTITAGATGYFEDTTNSDSVVSGDTISVMFTGGTSGSGGVVMIGVHQTVTDPAASGLLTLSLMGVGQ